MKRGGGEKTSNFGPKKNPQKKSNLRNPLTDANSSSISTTVSIEASTRGCLRFFSSKPQLKTPKSVPISNPRSNKIRPKLSSQPKSTHCQAPLQKKKKKLEPGFCRDEKNLVSEKVRRSQPKSTQGQAPVQKKLEPGEISDQNAFNFSRLRLDDETINVTTPMNKPQCHGSTTVLDSEIEEKLVLEKTLEKTPKTITPPIQPSVSPEIQYAMVGGSGSCYAAGHVLSGVPDKRKCKPRGILTVGQELGYEESVICSANGRRRVSLVPKPSGASMRWLLLSPCKEEEDQKSDHCLQNEESAELRRRMGPTPFHSLSNDVCIETSSGVDKMDLSVSPTELSKFDGFSDVSPSIFALKHDVEHHLVSCFSPSSFAGTTTPCKRVEESSPLSVDSLDSHNAMCTPQSDASSEKRRGFTWMKNVADHSESRFEFDPMADVFRTKSLSPRGRRSSWDPANVLPLPGLNFKLQDTLMDPILGVSSSSYRDSVDSQVRVSWREGLISRIFDMDELDSCRWLSDEEQLGLPDFDCKVDMSLESLDDDLVNITKSPEFVSEEPEVIGKSILNSPPKPRSCAESMSTDGGGLIASGDSDWTQCYKNHLFQG